MSSNRQRIAQLLAVTAISTAAASYPAFAEADSYGKLIVRRHAAPAAALDVRFGRVHAPHAFLLVVTEPSNEQLSFKWSLHCVGAAPRESGGASGRASIVSGHWVKRVRPTWIKHPVSCSGTIEGSTATSPVLVRIFAA
ncbi:MAG TPA: hypothetical protein VK774_07895 [Solirubrobacteraceae bacterium]|jgi:hypothetical protein|nr:hypothetical protein [Solirubrobacteraceae bacterium]